MRRRGPFLTVGVHVLRPRRYAGRVYNLPLAYFISFRAYGTWLHGDERGSVDTANNRFGRALLPANAARERWESEQLVGAPVQFDGPMRQVIDRTVREVCEHRGWYLLALNVRTNHVHCVVKASGPPEPVMNSMKSWATRRLVEGGLVERGSRVWSRHGSTVYLFRPDKVEEKCRYVIDGQ